MDASKPITNQVNQLRDMWRELWWAMVKGSVSEYDRLKRVDVFEFWKVYDMWKEQMQRERDAAKARAERKNK